MGENMAHWFYLYPQWLSLSLSLHTHTHTHAHTPPQLQLSMHITTYVSSSSSPGSSRSGSKMTESWPPSTLSDASVSSDRGPFKNPSEPSGDINRKYTNLNSIYLFHAVWLKSSVSLLAEDNAMSHNSFVVSPHITQHDCGHKTGPWGRSTRMWIKFINSTFFILFFWVRVSLCHPGWSAVAWS